MSSQYRYRGGNTKRIELKYDTSHPIEEGDLVFEDPVSGYARPAADMNSGGSVAIDQLAFAEYFRGVAAEKKGTQTGETSFRLNANDPQPPCITVLVDGEFEFDCHLDTLQDAGNGGRLGIFVDGTDGIPSSQKVMAADSGSVHCTIGLLKKQPADYFQTTDPHQTRCVMELAVGFAKGGPGAIGVTSQGTYTNASGQ